MAPWGWLKKWGGELKLSTNKKRVCPWCLEQMVCLCLCAFWWHPLGIGEVFQHSFRGLRQISELCSLPPSGPGLQLTSVCMYVYTIEFVTEEEHVWVSIAIVSIGGRRADLHWRSGLLQGAASSVTPQMLDLRTLFVYFFLFMLQSPLLLSTKFGPSS